MSALRFLIASLMTLMISTTFVFAVPYARFDENQTMIQKLNSIKKEKLKNALLKLVDKLIEKQENSKESMSETLVKLTSTFDKFQVDIAEKAEDIISSEKKMNMILKHYKKENPELTKEILAAEMRRYSSKPFWDDVKTSMVTSVKREGSVANFLKKLRDAIEYEDLSRIILTNVKVGASVLSIGILTIVVMSIWIGGLIGLYSMVIPVVLLFAALYGPIYFTTVGFFWVFIPGLVVSIQWILKLLGING